MMPHQVVWPTAFQPSSLHHFVLALSEELLSVFCSAVIDEKGKKLSSHSKSKHKKLTWKVKTGKNIWNNYSILVIFF